VAVGARSRDGLLVRFLFNNKIQMVVRMESKWRAKVFTLGSVQEDLQLSPEGSSKH